MTLDQRQYRFGCRVKRKFAPKIDDQQPVGAALVEEAQHPGFIRKHRAVDPDRALPENRILAAQRQQVTMESVDGGISLPFALIEHRSADGADVAGVGEQLLHLLAREAGKLCKKGSPPVADGACQLALVVGEIEERARSTEFLALEQHRNARHQQKIRSDRAQAPRARQCVAAPSAPRIGDLIVILEEDDEAIRREIQARGAARFLLPLVVLSLVEEAVLGGGDEFAWSAAVIAVIGLAVTSQRDRGAVVEIVVP